MKKGQKLLLFLFLNTFLSSGMNAQSTTNELPYDEIYAYGMDTDVQPILDILDQYNNLSEDGEAFKREFVLRFGAEIDECEYESTGDELIDELLGYFRDYWRKSMLEPTENYMMDLGRKVMPFLMRNHPPFKSPKQLDSLGNYLADFIRSRGFYTTEQVNPNGRLVDLLVWRKQEKMTFQTRISQSEKIEVPVIMMKEFVSLGWTEYATLGEHHPGGWTTETALYCVAKSYDLGSEAFEVSYLAHEGRHFADKKEFMDLSGKELEYRSKLTELSLAKKRVYKLIEFFINNANPNSENGHQLANHQVISDLSAYFFDIAFEDSIEAWRKIKVKKINKVSASLLTMDTERLRGN